MQTAPITSEKSIPRVNYGCRELKDAILLTGKCSHIGSPRFIRIFERPTEQEKIRILRRAIKRRLKLLPDELEFKLQWGNDTYSVLVDGKNFQWGLM